MLHQYVIHQQLRRDKNPLTKTVSLCMHKPVTFFEDIYIYMYIITYQNIDTTETHEANVNE